MNTALKRAVDRVSDVERLGDTDAAFDLSPTEKAVLRARYEQLKADPSARTCTIEEIAAELGVQLWTGSSVTTRMRTPR